MILKKKRLWQLSFAMSLLLLFLACSKQNIIRPNIKSKLARLDTIAQTQPEDFFLELDSLLINAKDLTSLEHAMLLFKKGEVLYLNFKYQEAINTHLKAYNLFTDLKDKYNEGRCLITLSGAYLHVGDIETAQVYALKALHLSQLIEDKRIEGKAYNQLFNLHFKLKDYKKALSYINITDSLFSKEIDTTSIISIKNNKASVYLKLKEYNKALKTYSEAMALSQSIRNPVLLASVLNNIGYTYIDAVKYENAEKFLRGAATLNKNIKATNAAPYKGLGNLFLLKSKNDSAAINYKKALDIYVANKNVKDEIEVRDKLIAISIMDGDYVKALDNQIVRDSLQLNVSSLEKNRLLNFANVNYEVKKKETEINHQKEINTRNQWLLISTILLFVLLGIATAFYVYNTKLRAANKAFNLEQSLLRVQMNPHFIFNTLAAIQNITLEGNAIKSSNYIAKFSKLIRQNFDYVRKEAIPLDKEIAMISNYIETQQLRFNNVFTYALEIDDSIDVSKIQVPPMLLQPFLENAIEYGLKEKKEGGKLLLVIKKEAEELLFVILDNGVGRSAKAKEEEVTEDLHATSIFKERLKMRKKGEEKSFLLQDLFDENNNPSGTKVVFKLKI
ncbi:tetratricopeptide repeat protein [Polaribacter sp. Z014]|uniref:tetratricopeptide repeat-containing sensor histidine kinase n=1 Tax=unclassified Polaribacter TaxID=196858 RepID=UPI00193B3362|nr:MULTISPECIES: tetratricopeptide repeat protein [unclassified Polaribacter]MCL7764080.1 tetratricopeptide repeat protein [Polaribacter sp. Z014]QVY65177.1 tetratricopeptide repeat protein [Polaribacter sp. Q13]